MLSTYFIRKQSKENDRIFLIVRKYRRHEIRTFSVFVFVFVCIAVFLLVFSFFPTFWRAFYFFIVKIIVLKSYLWENICQMEIFVIVGFLISSLANILKISCPLNHFRALHSHTFCVFNLIIREIYFLAVSLDILLKIAIRWIFVRLT